jgi:diguanylate cyclase (GGDEF)-like protein
MTSELPMILIVDSNKNVIDELSTIINHRYEILVASNKDEALQILREKRIDLILLDIDMNDGEIYEISQSLKLYLNNDELPLIFIINRVTKRYITRVYELGGSDYIKKPFIPMEVLKKIDRELNIITLIKELEFSYKRLEELTQVDTLTGLYNREFFIKISQNILKLSKREVQAVSLVLMDIDSFKKINDKFGYRVGDGIIVKLANILRDTKRESDVICRYGVGKFALLLPNTPIDGAKRVASKLKESLSIKHIDKIELNLTITIGVASIDLSPFSEDTIEFALQRAENEIENSSKNRDDSQK